VERRWEGEGGRGDRLLFLITVYVTHDKTMMLCERHSICSACSIRGVPSPHHSTQEDLDMMSKRCQDGVSIRMVSSWCRNGVGKVSQQCEHIVTIVSNWFGNGVKIVSESVKMVSV
jgi:hypothetical protein